MIALRAGSSILIEVKIIDKVSGIALDYNPESVQLSLYDSLGAIVINLASMVSSNSTGHYTYLHRSTQFQQSGPWTCLIKVTDGDSVYFIPQFVVFILTNGSVIDHFDYIAIKDSNSAVWYFSIISSSTDASDAQFILTTTVPTDSNLTAIDITPTVVPYSLKVLDELGGTVYIYPDTLGQVVVDTIQPSGVTYTILAGLIVKGRDRITYLYTGLSYLSALLTPTTYPEI